MANKVFPVTVEDRPDKTVVFCYLCNRPWYFEDRQEARRWRSLHEATHA